MLSVPIRKVALLLIVLLLGVGVAATQAQEGSDIPTVSVVASAEGLTAPETLPAGLVTIEYENNAEGPLFIVLTRLNDGVTLEDFMGALMEGPENILPLVTLKGGPAVAPGSTVAVTHHLPAGSYILLNLAAEVPQMASITAEGEGDMTYEAPETNLTVSLRDFNFDVPATVASGPQVWHLENLGQQWHEVALAPIDPDTTPEALHEMLAADAMLESPEEASLQQTLLWAPMSEGDEAWTTVDLEPGTYALICNLPELTAMAEGEMHVHHELGMVQIITVEAFTAYEDEAGLFAFRYPAAFTAYPGLFDAFLPFPNLGLTSSPEVTERSMAGEPVPDGGWGSAVMFMPRAMFTEMGIPEDAPLEDLAMAWMSATAGDAAEIEAPETTTLADGAEAVLFDIAGGTEDNLVTMYEITDDVFVLSSLLTAVDGRTDSMVDQWWALVNSIEFTGTLDDLLAGMSESE